MIWINHKREILLGVLGAIVSLFYLNNIPSYNTHKFFYVIILLGAVWTIYLEIRSGLVPWISVPTWILMAVVGIMHFQGMSVYFVVFHLICAVAALSLVVRGVGDLIVGIAVGLFCPSILIVGMIEGLASTLNKKPTKGAPALVMSISSLAVLIYIIT